jgi:hypothetical protein
MTDLPGRWRVFKALTIVQMILVLLMLVISVSGMFYGEKIGWRTFEAICYGVMMIFLYQGFSILNDNYPDTPLSLSQKRNFNVLFLLNFLLIAFLFAKVVAQWRFASTTLHDLSLDSRGNVVMLLPLIFAVLVFVLNIVHLAGMYKLRIMINDNNDKRIDEEFINGR